MRDCWPFFQQMENEKQESQVASLNSIFPEGKSLALTFAATKETFPETRRNFLAALATRQLRRRRQPSQLIFRQLRNRIQYEFLLYNTDCTKLPGNTVARKGSEVMAKSLPLIPRRPSGA
jgi:hypothetical protein